MKKNTFIICVFVLNIFLFSCSDDPNIFNSNEELNYSGNPENSESLNYENIPWDEKGIVM